MFFISEPVKLNSLDNDITIIQMKKNQKSPLSSPYLNYEESIKSYTY
jgi:hypothetical protein